MNPYNEQALEFLNKTNCQIIVNFNCNKVVGKHAHDIYDVTIKRGNRQFTFQYTQSVYHSQYYKDNFGITYTLNGSCRTGNRRIVDMDRYKEYITLCKGIIPNEYDILSTITKDDPMDFQTFCDNFGYNTDSVSHRGIYQDVVNEYNNVCCIWHENELELLKQIQ